ncbi:MAG: response regulator [Anaerohalosphaeraceae bacterium]|nr:response regulator [Anaerohalosphaeraceae bacterium]
MVLNGVNVLINNTSSDWLKTLKDILRTRSVELVPANRPCDALEIIESQPIHTAILDTDSRFSNGLSIIKVIRTKAPTLPCILLSSQSEQAMLTDALSLNVFSVVSRPIDPVVLQNQLHRIFVKRYNCEIFA